MASQGIELQYECPDMTHGDEHRYDICGVAIEKKKCDNSPHSKKVELPWKLWIKIILVVVMVSIMSLCISIAVTVLMNTRNDEVAKIWSCENEWILNNGHCYFFGSSNTSWQAAENHCKRLRSHLVKINDVGENLWLKTLMKELGSSDMWIGANDCGTEGQYKWVSDGSNVTYTDWDRLQPDDLNNEDCIELWDNYKTLKISHWNDNRCSSKFHYMCEK
ncbi:unnamed protein product [Mytilus coruscus]|uniref:C-type lectin domain-containing protein n=1 Tax=Mytilus coruscus TaxID=42192 RepID=A0A6J8ED31_MYTCO|nr:unnamed protein product [Mytilus coruscus]